MAEIIRFSIVKYYSSILKKDILLCKNPFQKFYLYIVQKNIKVKDKAFL